MSEVLYPHSVEEAVAEGGEYRAGGTDVEARRRLGLVGSPLVDLRRVAGLGGIERREDGSTWIGALTRITRLAADLTADYPALGLTAATLANPHTRAVATVGGNLCQDSRCWYYRSGVSCYRSGGDRCPAREGFSDFGVIFDRSRCIAPHPSSLAMALIAYQASLAIHGGRDRSVAELYGDGSDHGRQHLLEPGELIRGVILPPPAEGERGAYRRVTGRQLAEWPIVEAACRLVIGEGRVRSVAIVAGGVAPVPLRLQACEEALLGEEPTPERLVGAATLAARGANPVPGTEAKVQILERLVRQVLNDALGGNTRSELAFHELPLEG